MIRPGPVEWILAELHNRDENFNGLVPAVEGRQETPRHSLCGDEKAELRTFVREKRRRFLEKIGISHTPNSANVSLELMNICDNCRRSFTGSKMVKPTGISQIYKPESWNIELTIPRLPNTTRNCVFGEMASPLRSIPVRDQFKVLISHRLYIPPDAVLQ